MPQPLDFLRRNSLVSSESAAILNSRSGKHDYKSRSSAASAALGSWPSSGHPSLPDELDPGVQIELSAAVAGVVPDDSFTVEQAVNALGFGKFQMRLSFMTGLCWMADSMEMMILSVLSPALHCEWGLSQWRQAFMTTMVFFGMMLSAPFWGNFSDKYGRKMGLLIAAWLLFYYGILSSTAPTYIWLILLRSLVGFAIGCVPQSVTLYAEFLPQTQRAKCVILLDCFWSLGACLEVILALFVMPMWGWRAFLAISSLPVLLYCLVCFWMPESARFHAASGQSDKALATLKKIADENGKPMLLGRLIVDDGAGPGGGSGYSPWRRGRFSDLLMPELKWTSLLLWFIWFTCAFCYYGVVLMTTELFEVPSEQMCGAIDTQDQESCSVQCKALTTKDYLDLLWTTLAEFPGIFLTLLIIEKVGRKQTMAIELVAFALTLSMLFICYPGRPFLTVLLFTARGAVSGVFQAAYVYTPEVYPTSLRAVGVGTCSGAARFGAMVTPFIAQVLLRTSLSLAVATYAGLACLAAVACMLLPIETKGRQLDS